jgi:hypothetical protein
MLNAQPYEEKFLQANQHYEQGLYANALTIYAFLDPKGQVIWYNMGHCFYQLGRYPEAISCWQESLAGLSPEKYNCVQKNIAAAYKKLHKKYMPLWYEFLDGLLRWLFWWMSLRIIQISVIVMWYAAWICFYRKSRRGRHATMGLFFFLCGSLCMTWMVVDYHKYHVARGIIAHDTAPLHVIAHDTSHIICRTDVADIVTILEEKPGWYKIRSDKYAGWMQSHHVIKNGIVPALG